MPQNTAEFDDPAPERPSRLQRGLRGFGKALLWCLVALAGLYALLRLASHEWTALDQLWGGIIGLAVLGYVAHRERVAHLDRRLDKIERRLQVLFELTRRLSPNQ